MKVLHIISGFGGGISSFIRNIAIEIDDSYTFDVLSFTDYPNQFVEDIKKNNGKTLTMPRPKKVGFYTFYNQTKNLIRLHGPYDVVVSHLTGIYAVIFKQIVADQTDRFILHAHSSNDDTIDSFFTVLKRKVNRILSIQTADQLASCSILASEFMYGRKVLRPNRVMHIPNSISPKRYMIEYSEYEIKKLKESNGIPLNKPVFGNISRFNEQKNHVFMVDLIEYLVNSRRDFVWLFIGSGEEEEKIRQLVLSKKLESYVVFLGRREDANILYHLLDVFVLPSHYEGLPTVVVEAQAAGIPSVISNTITDEVDLGLNLVTYESLNSSFEDWMNNLDIAFNRKVPDTKLRLEKIEQNGFTNKSAAFLYKKFLNREISKFKIGDPLPKDNCN